MVYEPFQRALTGKLEVKKQNRGGTTWVKSQHEVREDFQKPNQNKGGLNFKKITSTRGIPFF